MPAEHDVVIVGAGLAGSAAAQQLVHAGYDVVVLEADREVGGRVQTDQIDGFLCDRGFQLLNPSYPALRHVVDLDGLDLRPFDAAVTVADGLDRVRLSLPWREPTGVVQTLKSGLVTPGEALRLTRWAGPALGPVSRLLARPDLTLAESLDRAGVRGRLRREVLQPFLTGVLAEADGVTSAHFAQLLLRAFVLGVPSVPAGGMGAFSAAVARPVRSRILCGVLVSKVQKQAGRWLVTSDHGEFSARAVIVATNATAAATLTGAETVAMRGLATWWFATPSAPDHTATLMVDGRGSAAGPVLNTAVMTQAAPSYAPPGRHLVQASTLWPNQPDHSGPTESEVRNQLQSMYGVPTHTWELVTRHEIPAALPAMNAPLQVRRPVALGEGLFVCGDHRDTASIQGALVSGLRTARAVGRTLGT